MSRVGVILLALAIDLLWGDPPNRWHPVVLMGNWLSLGRRRAPQQQRFWFGAGWIVAGLALFSLPWKLLRPFVTPKGAQSRKAAKSSLFQPSPAPVRGYFLLSLLFAAILLKPVLAYRNLRGAVGEILAALSADNLPEARRLLAWHLVSRDTGQLSAEEVIGATVESLAENVTDSLVAPLAAYSAGGLPAAWAYRFANTADAMWGYRTPELEQLGKFAARLDDALNWLPARLVGWMMVLSAWLVGEDAANAARTMLGQHSRTASPNAGWTMSAAAGALGITLTKRDVYALEGGSAPLTADTVRRALRLADVAAALSVAAVCAGAYFWHRK